MGAVVSPRIHKRWVYFAIAMVVLCLAALSVGVPYVWNLRRDLKAVKDTLKLTRVDAAKSVTSTKKLIDSTKNEWILHISNDSIHAEGDKCLVDLAAFGNLDDKIKPTSSLRLPVKKQHSKPLKPIPTPADRFAIAVAADSCPQKLEQIIGDNSNARQLLRKATSHARVLQQRPSR